MAKGHGKITLPPDADLRRNCPTVWTSFDNSFPDPNRPIFSLLMLAYTRRLAYLQSPPGYVETLHPEPNTPMRKLIDAMALHPLPYWQEESHRAEFDQLYKEIRELLTLLHPGQAASLDRDLRLNVEQILISHGVPIDERKKIVDRVAKPRKGAPASKRNMPVQAFDLRLKNPTLSWARLTERICTCGKKKHEHDPRCMQRIRQSVINLRKTLRKYDLQVP